MEGKVVNVREIFGNQQQYFLEDHTQDIRTRKKHLGHLKRLLREHESRIADAVHKDFGKAYFEVMSNELGLVYSEISTVMRKLSRWSRPERPPTSLLNLPGKSCVYPIPYGNVLVIAPWNYPVQLALIPVVSAIAAGNTVILKPSEVTVHTSGLLAELINAAFPPELLFVRQGGVPETTELLELPFNKIFFTGSPQVGRIVMKAAAEHLTPVTLELGGKNPVIVLPDCDLSRTAQRLVWGKFHNGGQACVAPDHIYVHESIHDALISEIRRKVGRHFNGNARSEESFPRIINASNFDRLQKLIDPSKSVVGGKGDREALFIEPTVMTGVDHTDPVMQEEVFGPVMPVLSYRDLDALLTTLKQRPSPLALYLFTRNKKLAKEIQSTFRSGTGMINDTVVHFINGTTPFGGIGESGMGSYHGRAGFECFSHRKTVLRKPNWFELWVKSPPYTKMKLIIVRLFLR
jgi:aldehyde dehydrogenase (NAD+)